MRLRSDRGAIEGFVVIAMLGLTLFAVVVAFVASMFIRHEQARTAADFAALAAAQTQECAAAAEAAKRNGAALRSCTLDDVDARVTVSIPSGYGELLLDAGAPLGFLASAHARF